MASKPTEQELYEAEQTMAELERAVPALQAWLRSQGLNCRQSVVLLGMTIGALLDEDGVSERGVQRILKSLTTCVVEDRRRKRRLTRGV